VRYELREISLIYCIEPNKNKEKNNGKELKTKTDIAKKKRLETITP